MKRSVLLLFWLHLAFAAHAQEPKPPFECSYGSGEASEKLSKALSNTKSCRAAASLLQQCAWGSSADAQFAAIVIPKCEKSFSDKLSAVEKQRYLDEMHLCAYEYSRQQGTLYISAAALCQVATATGWASQNHPQDPLPRASFDCTKAQSPLERAICANPQLGRADIVLSRVYQGVLHDAQGATRSALIRSEKQWLASLPYACKLQGTDPSQRSTDCLRNLFELRFTFLDSCASDNDLSHCLVQSTTND